MESRTDLARFYFKRGYKSGAEVGVADGRYSEILCQEIPGLSLYCVDPWSPYPGNWRTQAYQDQALETAVKKLAGYNVTILVETSLEASLKIADEALDFVFIDGAHDFDSVMLDVILWARKVRRGGIVSGHDYCHFTRSGVIEAVNRYTEIHRKELNLIGRNQKNYKDDRQPCWWFVR